MSARLRQLRVPRLLRALRSAPRIADMTFTSPHVRYIPAIRNRVELARERAS